MAILKNGNLTARVENAGAELKSLSKDGMEYLWQADATWWASSSPLLFPVVGGLTGGKFTHLGKSYTIKNHGFTRACTFTEVSATPERVEHRLTDNDATRAAWPFPFDLRVIHTLHGSKLEVAWKVQNTGSAEFFFSIGAHPGFNLPLVKGEKLTDYDIEFEKPESLPRRFLNAENAAEGIGSDETFKTHGHLLPMTEDLFERGAIVLHGQASRHATVKSRVSGRGVRVDFPGFPSLGIWAKPAAPYVCIEPWYGIMGRHDANPELSQKEGILKLAAGGSWTASYTIEVF